MALNQSLLAEHVADSSQFLSNGFVDFKGERFYKIAHVDHMRPFFMSMVSHSDHWLFISSNTGLTAGRVSAEQALFPYVAVDKVEDTFEVTGNKTLLKITHSGQTYWWEPFNRQGQGDPKRVRNLYKHVLGNKVCFEEYHTELNLVYRYVWSTSEEFGFVVDCELDNLSQQTYQIDLVDGLQNILPAQVPLEVQTQASNLVDAYRASELDPDTGLAIYSLYSGITDKPQPVEVLTANVVYALGVEQISTYLLSSNQLASFRQGGKLFSETTIRGVRASYFIGVKLSLLPHSHQHWQFVANVSMNQHQIESLVEQLTHHRQQHIQDIEHSVSQGTEKLRRIMGRADGLQTTASEIEDVHHYTNTLFNCLRGGVVLNQYNIQIADLLNDLYHFNRPIHARYADYFANLPAVIDWPRLQQQVNKLLDPQLSRLVNEYLPITFGRRHGDPSRPWNKFSIRLKDNHGQRLLSYEGNWRDIFQNWEALLVSYPSYIDNAISKFVNASTMDGYNPYRISKKGIDWEIEDPKDPWSYIGYWGDHQIIYLLKLLELSYKHDPSHLAARLFAPLFSYAKVPYRIKSFDQILRDPKNTIIYDEQEEQRIAERVNKVGADGRLVWDKLGHVYQVNLFEKLLVPLLAKLSNFVLEGGIWLNTQRPEWNDANNALVGQGLSMVTLYYLRRYLTFLIDVLPSQPTQVELSSEVYQWFAATAEAIDSAATRVVTDNQPGKPVTDQFRFNLLKDLGEAASIYRSQVYQYGFSGKVQVDLVVFTAFYQQALVLINHSIELNKRQDRLYHAYNILKFTDDQQVCIKPLYPMLEGQVAVLSSGALNVEQSIDLLTSLFDSALYRSDQHTFLLYPDKPLQGFLAKNAIDMAVVEQNDDLKHFVKETDQQVLLPSALGQCYRFNAQIADSSKIEAFVSKVAGNINHLDSVVSGLKQLYSATFNHDEFTGRSQGMFGFEGLGCTYWHMVVKLLLAVQEVYLTAQQQGDSADRLQLLGRFYYKIRSGLGFNKSAEQYGAFPYDPYSHTPSYAGAQQPGMTGQVKEEILTRFVELGILVKQGEVHINPCLLRVSEFTSGLKVLRYLAVNNEIKQVQVPAQGLAFTLYQIPLVYQLTDSPASIKVYAGDEVIYSSEQLTIPHQFARMMFERNGRITKVKVSLNLTHLFYE